MKTLLKLIFKIIWGAISKLLIIALVILCIFVFIWLIANSDPSSYISQ